MLTAAFTGLRKGEIRGLRWEDFDGLELRVKRSVWNSTENEPKTKRSKAPVPVVEQLAEALESHRQRMGKLVVGPIFQAGNGKTFEPRQFGTASDRSSVVTLRRLPEARGRAQARRTRLSEQQFPTLVARLARISSRTCH